jgi:membrane protease YdiL (CAAX protease family)
VAVVVTAGRINRVVRQVASLVAFCLVALIATLAVQGVWTGLLAANLKLSPAVPWSVAVMAVILWAVWRYFGGSWWPAQTQLARRHFRRATVVKGIVLSWSLVAGFLGLGSLVALWLVLVQLVRVPGNPSANFNGYSWLTVATVVVMASLVGAIAEELGLRGYILTRLEASVSGWLAVLLVAVAISPGHGSTQGFVWPILLWYFLADLMFGSLSLLSRSILPGIIVHAIGLLVFFSLIWPGDKYRGVASLGQQGLAFWFAVGSFLVLAALSMLAFGQLARHAVSSDSCHGQGPRASDAAIGARVRLQRFRCRGPSNRQA